MRTLIGIIVLSSVLLAQPTLTIRATEGGEQFTINYSAGAIQACTVFEQDGEQFFPVHCHFLAPSSFFYEDDWHDIDRAGTNWTVYATIAYPADNQWGMVRYNTNKLRLHR